jgi:hypothetical protein
MYTIREIYETRNTPSISMTERVFRNEPGVIRWLPPGGKRARIRVPQSVLDRVLLRMTVPERRRR